jgi:cytoskeletal protein RodZ
MESEIKPISTVILDALRARNLSVEKLAQITGVSDRFIALLLEEEFERMPAAPYTRGYLLKIAEALNLEGEKLWDEYLKNHEALRKSGPTDTLPPNRFETPRLINRKLVWIGIPVIIILGFFVIRIPSLFGVPYLSIANVPDNLIVSTSTYSISGKINPQDQLTVQGEIVYPDQNGDFLKAVMLQPGWNTIEFRFKKLLGIEHVTTKQIFYQAAQSNGTNTKTQ